MSDVDLDPDGQESEFDLMSLDDFEPRVEPLDFAAEDEIAREIEGLLLDLDRQDFAANLKTDFKRRMQKAVGKLAKITERQQERAAKAAKHQANSAFNKALAVQAMATMHGENGAPSGAEHAAHEEELHGGDSSSPLVNIMLQSKIQQLQKQVELVENKARAVTSQWITDKDRYRDLLEKKNAEKEELALHVAILDRKLRFKEQKERDPNMIRTNDEANELKQVKELLEQLEKELEEKKKILSATALELSDAKLEISTLHSRVDVQGKRIEELLRQEDALHAQIEGLQKEVRDAQTKTRRLENNIDDLQRALDSQKEDYLALKERALKKEEEFEDKAQVFRSKVEELKAHVQSMWDEKESQAKTLNAEIDAVAKKLAQSERERESEARAQKLLVASFSHAVRVGQRLNFAMEEEQKSVKEQMSLLQGRLESVTDSFKKMSDRVVHTLRDSFAHEQEEGRELQREREKEKGIQRRADVLQEAMAALQKESAQLKVEVQRLQNELATERMKQKSVEMDSQQEREKLAKALEDKAIEEKQEIEKREREKAEIDRKALLMIEEQQEIEKMRDVMEEEREHELLAEIQKQKDDFDGEKKALQDLLRSLQDTLKQREKELAEAITALQELQAQEEKEDERDAVSVHSVGVGEGDVLSRRSSKSSLLSRESSVRKERGKTSRASSATSLTETEKEKERERIAEMERELERLRALEREKGDTAPPLREKHPSGLKLSERRLQTVFSADSETETDFDWHALSAERDAEAEKARERIRELEEELERVKLSLRTDSVEMAVQTEEEVDVDALSPEEGNEEQEEEEEEDDDDDDSSARAPRKEEKKRVVAVGVDGETQTDVVSFMSTAMQVNRDAEDREIERKRKLAEEQQERERERLREIEKQREKMEAEERRMLAEKKEKKKARKNLLRAARKGGVTSDEEKASADDNDSDNDSDGEVDIEKELDQIVPDAKKEEKKDLVSVLTQTDLGDSFEIPRPLFALEEIERLLRDALMSNNFYFSRDSGAFSNSLPIEEDFFQELVRGFFSLGEDALTLVEKIQKDRECLEEEFEGFLSRCSRDLVVKMENSREDSLQRLRAEHAEFLAEKLQETEQRMREELRAALMDQEERKKEELQREKTKHEEQLQKAVVKIKKLREQQEVELQKAKEKWEREVFGGGLDGVAEEEMTEAEREKLRSRKRAMLLDRSSSSVILAFEEMKKKKAEERQKEIEKMRGEIEQEVRAKILREVEEQRWEREKQMSEVKDEKQEREHMLQQLWDELPDNMRGECDIQRLREELLSGDLMHIGDIRRENFDRLRGKDMGSDALVSLTAIEHTLRYDSEALEDESEGQRASPFDISSSATAAIDEKEHAARERQRRMQHKTLGIQKTLLQKQVVEQTSVLDLYAFLHATERHLSLLSSLSAWRALGYYQAGGLFADVLQVHRDVLRECISQKGGLSAAFRELSKSDLSVDTQRWPPNLRVKALEVFRIELLKEREQLLKERELLKEKNDEYAALTSRANSLRRGSSLASLSKDRDRSASFDDESVGSETSLTTEQTFKQTFTRAAAHHERQLHKPHNPNPNPNPNPNHFHSHTGAHSHPVAAHKTEGSDAKEEGKEDAKAEKPILKKEDSAMILAKIANELDFSLSPPHPEEKGHRHTDDNKHHSHHNHHEAFSMTTPPVLLGGLHYKLDHICYLALRGEAAMYDLLSTLYEGFMHWEKYENVIANNVFQTCLGKSGLPFVEELLSALIRATLQSEIPLQLKELFEKICHVLDICDTYAESLSDPEQLADLLFAVHKRAANEGLGELLPVPENKQEEKATPSEFAEQGMIKTHKLDRSGSEAGVSSSSSVANLFSLSSQSEESVRAIAAVASHALKRVKHPLSSNFSGKLGHTELSVKPSFQGPRTFSLNPGLLWTFTDEENEQRRRFFNGHISSNSHHHSHSHSHAHATSGVFSLKRVTTFDCGTQTLPDDSSPPLHAQALRLSPVPLSPMSPALSRSVMSTRTFTRANTNANVIAETESAGAGSSLLEEQRDDDAVSVMSATSAASLAATEPKKVSTPSSRALRRKSITGTRNDSPPPSLSNGLPKGFALAFFKDDEFELAPGIFLAAQERVNEMLCEQFAEQQRQKAAAMAAKKAEEERLEREGETYESLMKKKRQRNKKDSDNKKDEIDLPTLLKRVKLLPDNVRYIHGSAIHEEDDFPPSLQSAPAFLEIPEIAGLRAVVLPAVYPLRHGVNLINGFRYIGQGNEHVFNALDIFCGKNESSELLSLPRDLLLLQLMSDFLEPEKALDKNNINSNEVITPLPRGLYRAVLSDRIVRDEAMFKLQRDKETFSNNPPVKKAKVLLTAKEREQERERALRGEEDEPEMEIPLGHELVQLKDCLIDFPVGVEVAPGVRIAATPQNMVLPERVRLVKKARSTPLPPFLLPLSACTHRGGGENVHAKMSEAITVIAKPPGVDFELGTELVRIPAGLSLPPGMTPVPLSQYPEGLDPSSLLHNVELVQLAPKFDFPDTCRLTGAWHILPRPYKVHLQPNQYIVYPDPHLEEQAVPPLPAYACVIAMPSLPANVILPARSVCVELLLAKHTQFCLPEGALLGPGVTVLHPRTFKENARDFSAAFPSTAFLTDPALEEENEKAKGEQKILREHAKQRQRPAVNVLLVRRAPGATLPVSVERGSRNDLPHGVLLEENMEIVRVRVRFELPPGTKIDVGASLGRAVQLYPGTQLLCSTVTGDRHTARALTVLERPPGLALLDDPGVELVQKPPKGVFLPFEYLQVHPASRELQLAMPEDALLVRLPRDVSLLSARELSSRVTVGVESVVTEYSQALPVGTIFASRQSRREQWPPGMQSVPLSALSQRLLRVLDAINTDSDDRDREEKEKERKAREAAHHGNSKTTTDAKSEEVSELARAVSKTLEKGREKREEKEKAGKKKKERSAAERVRAHVNVEVVSLSPSLELPAGVEIIEGVFIAERPFWLPRQSNIAVLRVSDREKDLQRLAEKEFHEVRVRGDDIKLFPRREYAVNDEHEMDSERENESEGEEEKKEEETQNAEEEDSEKTRENERKEREAEKESRKQRERARDAAVSRETDLSTLQRRFPLPADCVVVLLPPVFEVYSWKNVMPGVHALSCENSSVSLPPGHFLIQRTRSLSKSSTGDAMLPCAGFALGVSEEYKSLRLSALPPQAEVMHLLPTRALPAGVNVINTSVLGRNIFNDHSLSLSVGSGVSSKANNTKRRFESQWLAQLAERERVSAHAVHISWPTRAQRESERLMEIDPSLFREPHCLVLCESRSLALANKAYPSNLVKHTESDRIVQLLFGNKIETGEETNSNNKTMRKDRRESAASASSANQQSLSRISRKTLSLCDVLHVVKVSNGFPSPRDRLAPPLLSKMGSLSVDYRKEDEKANEKNFEVVCPRLTRLQRLRLLDPAVEINRFLSALHVFRFGKDAAQVERELKHLRFDLFETTLFRALAANDKLKNDADKLRSQLRKAHAANTNMQKALDMIENEFTEMKDQLQEQDDIRAIVKKLKEKLAEKDAEIEGAQAVGIEEMQRLQAQVDVLTTQLAQYRNSGLSPTEDLTTAEREERLRNLRVSVEREVRDEIVVEMSASFQQTMQSDLSRFAQMVCSHLRTLSLSLDNDVLRPLLSSFALPAIVFDTEQRRGVHGENAQEREEDTASAVSLLTDHKDVISAADDGSIGGSVSPSLAPTYVSQPASWKPRPDLTRDKDGKKLPVSKEFPLDVKALYKPEAAPCVAQSLSLSLALPHRREDDDNDETSSYLSITKSMVLSSSTPSLSHNREREKEVHSVNGDAQLGRTVGDLLRRRKVQKEKEAERERGRARLPRLADDPPINFSLSPRVSSATTRKGSVISAPLSLSDNEQDRVFSSQSVMQRLQMWSVQSAHSAEDSLTRDAQNVQHALALLVEKVNDSFSAIARIQTQYLVSEQRMREREKVNEKERAKDSKDSESTNGDITMSSSPLKAPNTSLQWLTTEDSLRLTMEAFLSLCAHFVSSQQRQYLHTLSVLDSESRFLARELQTTRNKYDLLQSFFHEHKKALQSHSHDDVAVRENENLREKVISLENKIERLFSDQMKSDMESLQAQITQVTQLTELEKQLQFCALSLKQIAVKEEAKLPKDFVAANSANSTASVSGKAKKPLSEKEIKAVRHHCQRLRRRAQTCQERAALIEREITDCIAALLEHVEAYQRSVQGVLPPKIMLMMLQRSVQYYDKLKMQQPFSSNASWDSSSVMSFESAASSVAGFGFATPSQSALRLQPLQPPQSVPAQTRAGRLQPVSASQPTAQGSLEWFDDDASQISQHSAFASVSVGGATAATTATSATTARPPLRDSRAILSDASKSLHQSKVKFGSIGSIPAAPEKSHLTRRETASRTTDKKTSRF